MDTFFFRNSPSQDSFAIVDHSFVCVFYFHFDNYTSDVITSDVITNNCKQWQLKCVGINKLYNLFRVRIEKKIYRTAHS